MGYPLPASQVDHTARRWRLVLHQVWGEGLVKAVIRVLAALGYGQCTHPAIYQKSDGRWYCTECQQLRA